MTKRLKRRNKNKTRQKNKKRVKRGGVVLSRESSFKKIFFGNCENETKTCITFNQDFDEILKKMLEKEKIILKLQKKKITDKSYNVLATELATRNKNDKRHEILKLKIFGDDYKFVGTKSAGSAAFINLYEKDVNRLEKFKFSITLGKYGSIPSTLNKKKYAIKIFKNNIYFIKEKLILDLLETSQLGYPSYLVPAYPIKDDQKCIIIMHFKEKDLFTYYCENTGVTQKKNQIIFENILKGLINFLEYDMFYTDLKFENILIDNDSKIYFADIGSITPSGEKYIIYKEKMAKLLIEINSKVDNLEMSTFSYTCIQESNIDILNTEAYIRNYLHQITVIYLMLFGENKNISINIGYYNDKFDTQKKDNWCSPAIDYNYDRNVLPDVLKPYFFDNTTLYTSHQTYDSNDMANLVKQKIETILKTVSYPGDINLPGDTNFPINTPPLSDDDNTSPLSNTPENLEHLMLPTDP